MELRFNNAALTWDTPFRIKRSKILSKEVLENIPESVFQKTLEFGCGTGLLTFNLLNKIREGLLIDSSEEMIKIVNTKIKQNKIKNILNAKCLDITKINVDNSNYSFVYSSMSLHHIVDINLVAKKINQMLINGGYLCIIDLCSDNGLFHQNEIEFKGHHGFDVNELTRMFNNNGFELIKSKIIYTDIKEIETIMHKYNLFMLIMKKI